MIYTFNEEDIITTDGYLNFCLKNNICYVKTDYFRIGRFNWRGKEHPDVEISDRIVVGHSDYDVTESIVNRFSKVLCVNKNTLNPNSYSLPLGITNDCNDSEMHHVYGNKEMMVNVSKEDSVKDTLLYLNFNKDTHSDRADIYNFFKYFNYVKVGCVIGTMSGRENFLREIKSSKFVLCPRGNGIDTHRLWESLYMGSIPIVKYHPTHDNIRDLPILFIDNWSSICESFLNEKYKEIINKKWNMNKLKISHWEEFIKSEINS